MVKLLIADDEPEIIELIELYLSEAPYEIYKANDGEAALEIVAQHDIALGIIDIMMPKMNGFQVIKRIREKHHMPLIVLSAREDYADKIHGLEIGADDYMTKPFNVLELKARIQAHLRRFMKSGGSETPSAVALGAFKVDFETCDVTLDGAPVYLTAKEFQILALMMSRPGRVFTKQQIYEAVWEETYYGDENTIRIHMSHLRDKLSGDVIQTVRGLGYKIDASKVSAC